MTIFSKKNKKKQFTDMDRQKIADLEFWVIKDIYTSLNKH